MLPVKFALFGQVVSEEKIFRNRPTRKKNFQCQPCLLTDRDESIDLYRGPSIDGSYHVWIHLANWFQMRRFSENDQPETRIANGSHIC